MASMDVVVGCTAQPRPVTSACSAPQYHPKALPWLLGPMLRWWRAHATQAVGWLFVVRHLQIRPRDQGVLPPAVLT